VRALPDIFDFSREDSMKRLYILSLLVALPACSGDDNAPNGATEDGSTSDSTTPDTGSVGDDAFSSDANSSHLDASVGDTGTESEGSTSDATSSDAGPATGDGNALDAAPSDASAPDGTDLDGSCPAAWFVTPDVDTSIAIPADAGTLRVILHAGASGTQDYVCSMSSADAGYTWNLRTPDATLVDCHGTAIARHFASEAGATAPEWQLNDGTFVVAKKQGSFTPDGGSGSIPWLLLHIVTGADGGVLDPAQFIQRLSTDGGNAPSVTCDDAGAAINVPYSADYYFYGP
jgi:hypothetical protein